MEQAVDPNTSASTANASGSQSSAPSPKAANVSVSASPSLRPSTGSVSISGSPALRAAAVPFVPRSSSMSGLTGPAPAAFSLSSSPALGASSAAALSASHGSEQFTLSSFGSESHHDGSGPLGSPKYMDDEMRKEAVRGQIEFYFSNNNLWKDKFLREQIAQHAEGFVPLSLVASFKRVQRLSSDPVLIAAALAHSSALQLSPDGSMIRRIHPLPQRDEKAHAKKCIFVDGLPADSSIDSVGAVFAPFGKVALVQLHASSSGAGVAAEVEFDSAAHAKAAVGAAQAGALPGLTVLTRTQHLKAQQAKKPKAAAKSESPVVQAAVPARKPNTRDPMNWRLERSPQVGASPSPNLRSSPSPNLRASNSPSAGPARSPNPASKEWVDLSGPSALSLGAPSSHRSSITGSPHLGSAPAPAPAHPPSGRASLGGSPRLGASSPPHSHGSPHMHGHAHPPVTALTHLRGLRADEENTPSPRDGRQGLSARARNQHSRSPAHESSPSTRDDGPDASVRRPLRLSGVGTLRKAVPGRCRTAKGPDGSKGFAAKVRPRSLVAAALAVRVVH